MSVNGITTNNYSDSYSNYTSQGKSQTETTSSTATDVAAVYEPSTTQDASTTYTPDTNLIAKLQADADAQTAQLRSIVENLISGQGKALGSADSIWSFLASGDFTVDAATQEQAQKDIAEDGYWGVEQTSDRIIDFATALTGGDPSMIEEMRDAFIKGFEMATATWGDTLPDISQDTYAAVMEKFDQLAGITSTEA